MPAALNDDAVAYLKQQGLPVTTTSLNRTMNLLQQQPDLRPSYAGQGPVDVDIETMRPVNSSIEGRSLPPLQAQSNTNGSFGQAFKSARASGLSEFEWNGKRYNTKYKEEVNQASPSSGAPSQTDKPGIDEGEVNQSVNKVAEAEMQSDLADEKNQFAEADEAKRNTKRISAGRGGYVERAMSDEEIADRDMNSLLENLLLGGAAAGVGGAAIAAARGNKEPAGYRQQRMTQEDLTGRQAPVDPHEELATGGKPKQQRMTDADLFQNQQVDRMMQDSDIMLDKDFADTEFLKTVSEDNGFIPEEVQAAKAVQSKNKIAAKNAYNKLKGIGGVDKRLLTILKGLM